MKSIVTYVRNLLGWSDEAPETELSRLSFKRDRGDEGFSSEDETPSSKRLKQLLKSRFPGATASQGHTNGWGKEENISNVRNVPIHLERGHASTSTPIESGASLGRRVRTVPVQLVGLKDRDSTPGRKTKMAPAKPILHAVLDDDDEDEVAVVETKKPVINRKPKYYVNLEDYENIEDYENHPKHTNDDDVIFVKKVIAPPARKPYWCYKDDDEDEIDVEEPVYYKLRRTVNDRNSLSPRTNKFIGPVGVTKSYKKTAPVTSWLLGNKMAKNRYPGFNGNSRATLAEVFNLDEKKNYRELIKKVTESMNPVPFGRPLEIADTAEMFASFRNTQRSQKKALKEVNLLEPRFKTDQENSLLKEYDPITVASINSSDSEVEIVPSEASTSSSSVKIDPINTLKDSHRDMAVTSGDWLAKIDIKYRKKKQLSQAKLQDARRESDIISKVNSDQKIAHLEHKLKYELSIPESLFEEPQPIVELPILTAEQLKLVNKALGPGPAGQLLVEKFNLRIHRRDMQTLAGLNWLNDEVINFYMSLLMQRCEEKPDLPRVYAANTFFYPKLMQSGQAGLRRWTRKVDVFANDLMIVPVHLGVHWCLSIIDFRVKTVSYLDSMGRRNQGCLDALLQYLKDEHQDKKGQPFDDQGWTTKCLKDIPQQMNGSDCGMFACTFAEFSARNAPYTFTQAHMPLLRRKAALEILMGSLML